MTPHRGHQGERIPVDLHAHTRLSPDAVMTPAELVERAAEVGLARVAVTDHGEVDGALEARAIDPGRVIVGEEIRCRCRTELIGLYLRERIPEGLPLEETAERIRDQGGVVYAPHPYAYLLLPAWRAARALAVADAVEVFNSRAFLPVWNRRAVQAAAGARLPVAAASDAHFARELGRAYAVMPYFRGPAELRDALREALPVGRRLGHPALHLASAGLKVARLFRGGPTSRSEGDWSAPRAERSELVPR